MSKLARLLARQFRWMMASFGVCVIALATVSVWSLSVATNASNSLYRDKLQTLQATTSASDAIRDAYEGALAVLTTSDLAQRRAALDQVLDDTVPNVDTSLDELAGLSTIDTRTEHALVKRIQTSWRAVRLLLVPGLATNAGPDPLLQREIRAEYGGIAPAVSQLRAVEQREAARAAAKSHTAWVDALLVIVATAGLALIGLAYVVLRSGRRLVQRAVAEEAQQQEFAQTMQHAASEDDAYRLITRHLERTLHGAHPVILNRNNSADRLEAMTEIPDDWDLATRLEGAEPRSCIAIRTARTYQRTAIEAPLLPCGVCGDCPQTTLCSPVTVTGEVIGSVLIESATGFDDDDSRSVQRTVAEGAPVIANLRNLAIAEMRAATDALTGLPNKRAVAYALKRMVAQASRTLTPLAVLALDLDHFKQINDQYGHPRGDEVLAAVGAVLRSATRDADFVGRNGGEEFLALLPTTDAAGARTIAEKIGDAVRQIYVRDVDRNITVSIGIAVLPDHAGDAERLERAADRALYTAKTNGRDRVETAMATALAPGLEFAGPFEA